MAATAALALTSIVGCTPKETAGASSSHGCVNVRDLRGISVLFDQVRIGDKVVVYR